MAVTLVGSLGISAWQGSRIAAEESDLVAHTYAVMRALEAAAEHMIDVATAARGFALSGSPELSEHFRKSSGTLEEDLVKLRQLTADNSRQQRRLNALQSQIAAVLDYSNEIVRNRQDQRSDFPAAEIARGESLTQTARKTIEKMQAEEDRLLQERAARSASARQRSAAVLLTATCAAAAFLILAALAVRRQIGISEQARAQVIQLNIGLEQRVLKRTAALQSEIEARTAIAEQTRESQERLAGVIASAMNAVITIDAEQRIVLFNRAAENIFGCSDRDALGKSLDHFIPERFREVHRRHIANFAATGTTSRTMGERRTWPPCAPTAWNFPSRPPSPKWRVAGKNCLPPLCATSASASGQKPRCSG